MLEIKRKFLIDGISLKDILEDNDIEVLWVKTVEQHYIGINGNFEFWIKKTDTGNLITIETLGDLERVEIEKEISLKEFDKLKKYTLSGINKERYFLNYKKEQIIELDVYKDRDLMVAEIEMGIIDEDIILPDWFGKEIPKTLNT